MKLPKPDLDLDFPLMRALKLRRSVREWKYDDLSMQELSNVLWSACGVSQEVTEFDKCKRTVPSGCDAQEVRVYVVLERGVFLYDEVKHELVKVLSGDVRDKLSDQSEYHFAPLSLIYVSDFDRFEGSVYETEKEMFFMSAVDTGFLGQNVYLCCTALGLSTVFTGLFDREKVHKVLGLRDVEHVSFVQFVGKSL